MINRYAFRLAAVAALLVVLFAFPSPSHAQETSAGSAAAPVDPVIVGAGDIAKCDIIGGAAATAQLLDRIPGTVITMGDNAYDDGSAKDFTQCYTPTWGRHKARTRPSPGNHDFRADNGRSYYAYFGENAGPAGRGYYSYDVGTWHVVSLNSVGDVTADSDQGRWLKADLAAHPSDCILAYWHAPRFSSGSHGNDPRMVEFWQILYDAGADIVIGGHDHTYERFAPQDPSGKPDAERGIRQFVVGTGGGGVYKFKKQARNSEVRDNSAYGVLKLTLGAGRYAWEFVPMRGQAFTDSGTGTCTPRP